MIYPVRAIRSSRAAKILVLLVTILACIMAISAVSSNWLQSRAYALLLSLVLIVCSTAVLCLWFSRILIPRVRSMVSMAEACADGDFSGRLTDTSPDELGRLAASLNRMTAGFEENIARRNEACEEVQRLTGLLDELIARSERMAMVNGLTAGYAHEINNPLGAIMQNAQNIERRLSVDLPGNLPVAREAGIELESLHEYLDRRGVPGFVANIRAAGARAAAIMTRMMRYSRTGEPVREASAVDAVLDQVLELASYDYELKKLYDFRQIEVVREYDSSLPPVMMTVPDMEQVFMSIIRNAAEAMKMSAMKRRARITLRTREEGDSALVEIEDNGPGMDDDVQRRIFNPSFSTKGKGIGLGLAAARFIITSGHRGSIAVRSMPGEGSCVTIRLPLDGSGL